MPQIVIGVDIAKHWIDVFNPKTRQYLRIDTTPKALKPLQAHCLMKLLSSWKPPAVMKDH